MAERLQKHLAAAGLGSRRACEELIRAGRVTVNGRVAELGASVDPAVDRVEVDGRPVRRQPLEYWLLNKPAGVVTTAADTHDRATVLHLVPAAGRVFPVGRLDMDTTGVLLLTNDGELTNRLLHPRFGVEKEYEVTVSGEPSTGALRRLESGVRLEDGTTAPAHVVEVRHSGASSTIRLVIHEGRKRQVKRMLEAVGHPVTRLHRRRFGPLTDEGLAIGGVRELTPAELQALGRAAGLGPGGP